MAQYLSYSFARPADTTAYAAGDLVANNVTAGSVVPLSWAFANTAANLREIKLTSTNTTITNGTFNLWLLNASPTVTNGDNGAIAGATLASIIKVCPIDLDASMGGSGSWGVAYYDKGLIQLGGTVYGLLEARGAYVPASGETFTIYLGIEP